MRWRPPVSTRTYTLLPCTPLFRSQRPRRDEAAPDGDRRGHPRSPARHREAARRRASVAIDRARLAARLAAREGFPPPRRRAGGGTVMARRIWSIAIASIVSGAVAGCTATLAPAKTPAQQIGRAHV